MAAAHQALDALVDLHDGYLHGFEGLGMTIRTNPTTGEVYSGRTSGTGSSLEKIARRDASHERNTEGFGPAQLDQTSESSDAVRGREQQLIDYHRAVGDAADQINGISPTNDKLDQYMAAAHPERLEAPGVD
jgi:hypothetical protein